MLSTKHIYIFYVITYHKKNINAKLKSLKGFHRKKKYILKLKNPRYVDSLCDVCPINYTSFKDIVCKMNREVLSEIIAGKTLKMGHNLGDLYITEYNREMRVSEKGNLNLKKNWGASKKRKQEIIDSGGTPFESYKDEVGAIIGDNKGEKWLVYYTDSLIRKFNWLRLRFRESGSTVYPLKNITRYCFKATKDNRILLNRKLKENNLELT